MSFLNIFFSGAYFTLLILCMLFDYSDLFSEYVEELIKYLPINKNIHPRTMIMPLAVLVSVFSWVGFVFVIWLITDFYNWKNNKED